MISEEWISTDVLIIGGGLAGCLAAIQARELNVDVTLVDKNFVGRKGDSHITAGVIEIFNPEWGHDFDEWMNYTIKVGDRVNPDAAWYYPDPKESAAEIKDYVAFWKGVDIIE